MMRRVWWRNGKELIGKNLLTGLVSRACITARTAAKAKGSFLYRGERKRERGKETECLLGERGWSMKGGNGRETRQLLPQPD